MSNSLGAESPERGALAAARLAELALSERALAGAVRRTHRSGPDLSAAAQSRLIAALPGAYPGAPLVAVRAAGAPAPRIAVAAREEGLWWPAARADAQAVERLLIDPGGPPAALERLLRRDAQVGAPSEAALLAEGRGAEAARLAQRFGVRPLAGPEGALSGALQRVRAARPGPETGWAALGGLAVEVLGAATPEALDPLDPAFWSARFWDPWRLRECDPAEGLEIARFFAETAARRPRPVVTVGLSPWKRKSVTPFLTGAAGPPAHRRDLRTALALAEETGAEIAFWGPSRDPADALRAEGRRVLLLEDGFIRSVGLGVRHERPCSLIVAREALHFEADRPSDLRAGLMAWRPSEAARARAARLRRILTEQEVTKYNLGDAAESGLPETPKTRVLVAGQVERDASLRFGGGLVGGNLALLRAARARWPDACVVYKPHPDVVAGYRRDAALRAETDALADAVVPQASAGQALDWAEVVETMTSQLGFEALLRGKRVVCHGAPFYGELGLTEDLAPRRPALSVSLEDLISVALLAYPLYVDPWSRIPAPPEVVIEALVQARRKPQPVLERLWKRGVSRVLSWLP